MGVHQHNVRAGNRFNRWVVIEAYVDRDSDRRWLHTCKCSCEAGTIRNVSEKTLKNGGSKSCGCWKREVTIARNKSKGARVTVGGEVYFLSDLAKAADQNPRVVAARYHRYGWSVPRALLSKLHNKPKTGRTTLEKMWARLKAYQKEDREQRKVEVK
jgi:hypothetical protein